MLQNSNLNLILQLQKSFYGFLDFQIRRSCFYNNTHQT